MNAKLNEMIRSKIETLMQQKSIKQNELAEMIGVTPQNINAYMRGKRRFGEKQLNRVAAALAIDVDALFVSQNVSFEEMIGRNIPIV
ncbi:Helix-turn-helix type 3 domain protein, partial [Candidatus Magnetobacterium bavaricum]